MNISPDDFLFLEQYWAYYTPVPETLDLIVIQHKDHVIGKSSPVSKEEFDDWVTVNWAFKLVEQDDLLGAVQSLILAVKPHRIELIVNLEESFGRRYF